ncbi:hypothetical protein TspCOW1_20120 [Thiohalobacter sp. COW1]|uniref:DUF2784 domain-containing protein n=1 Tax=Thiohalobacter thiocyanaticus TaxID=585455 RepID=A0A1Z4VN77_9GAMM|nr:MULTISPECIES: DUF2784 domain-containing protein [Thiohalobacter]BAZ93080.1 uncharacterized protein FOKN1_0678 [Thiohalobacter thiocyanaticus]BCO31909.1 hypothetical protein TspCOW1_20120 [Thiohalobacter sp. COW1]
MIYHWLADLVLFAHLLFILFVLLGGGLALRWPGIVWLHLPAAVWGALVEIFAWPCPLTPLENALRARAGETGYAGGFIEHYLQPLIYPGWLTADIGLVLGAGVIVVNLFIYAVVIAASRRRA